MATNKIHFVSWILFPYLYGGDKDYFSDESAAEVIINDSIRCWTGERGYTHFTNNPSTGKTSWITFPNFDIKEWTKELILTSSSYNAGKVGKAVIDETTDVTEFWRHNFYNPKGEFNSQRERFFMHLIQDSVYDDFVRTVIDTSSMYEDRYVFQGKVMTGEELRGKGDSRWTSGLLSELDDQFFVRLAKRMFDLTGKTATKAWLVYRMGKAIEARYPKDLAESTIKYISLSEKANEIITIADFDLEVWPVHNKIVDIFIDILFADMKQSLLDLKAI